MQTQEVGIQPNVRVTLKSDAELLDEVMVVAFGTAKKSAFTGSAKVLGSEKLEQSQVTNVADALAGAVPGVTLTSNDGAPGSQSTINIRGFSSLNAKNDPLIIVDGAPYSGDIANLNPNDIESMTVLKDAASNALYGARGANGVIIITTKKAKGGEAIVTFDAKWGVNTKAMKQYDVITSPGQYYEMHYAALRNYYMSQGMGEQAAWQQANANLTGSSGNGGLGYNVYNVPEGQMLIGLNGKLNPNATLGRIVSYNGEEYLLRPDDWEDEGVRHGLRQEYNLSVSGSTDKGSFYASIGYLGNEGIVKNSDYERLTARLKADYRAKEWLNMGANMSYTRFDRNSLSENGNGTSVANIWAFTTQLAPIYPLYVRNADGSVKLDDNGFRMKDYGDGMNAGMNRAFLPNANPLMDTELNRNNGEGNAFTVNGFATVTFLPGLTATVNATANIDETRTTFYYNPYYGQFDTTGGTLQKVHERVYDYNFQQLLNYTGSIAGVHNIDVTLGHEYYDYRYMYLTASKSNMLSPDNLELGGAVVDGQNADSEKERYNNEGYFGRVQYNYDNRYFAQGSFRRDASSRFSPDHRWGSFWSLGAAWLINKENWFNAPWVQELKLKASVGSQGNDNIGNYRYTDLYNVTNSDGNIGVSFDSKGTEDITWETNTNFNIGAEFMLWNRVSGSIEYYYRKTSDMLFSFSVAPSLGYTSYYDNIGDMVNSGVELDLNINLLKTRNLNWDFRLNLSSLKNRITKLAPEKKTSTLYTLDGKAYNGYTNGNFFVGEDLSIYTWQFKEYAGVNEQGQSMWYKNVTDESGKITGREKTTSYSDADYYVTESTLPKVYGGFGTSLQAYGVDFSINFTYQLGGKQYDATYAQFMSSPSATLGYNYHKDLYNSWTPENTDTDIPRFMYGDDDSGRASTRFLTKASYLNLQNINIGYTLPARWTKKAAISSLRIYLSAENVAYWSARKGFDPRQAFDAASNATYYSPMRTISGGVTFKF